MIICRQPVNQTRSTTSARIHTFAATLAILFGAGSLPAADVTAGLIEAIQAEKDQLMLVELQARSRHHKV